MSHPRDASVVAGAPRVTVIVVNFNGGEMVRGALAGLRDQSFADFETIVVDNGSSDGSDQAIRREFPEVRLIAAATNLGFAGGNNLGREHARGRYLALLNNDAVPDRDWLREMVAALERDAGAAAVTSRISFLTPFVEVELGPVEAVVNGTPDTPRAHRTPDPFELLIDESSAFVGCDYEKPIFLDCPRTREIGPGGRPLRRYTAESRFFLPVAEGVGEAELRLVVASAGRESVGPISVSLGGCEVGRIEASDEPSEIGIAVPGTVIDTAARELINNAGTELDGSGRTHDRGIYEADRGQYERPRQVEAFCGAAAVLRSSAIDRVGFFDRDFFMYFEDTDLSWRLRSHGFRLLYQPTARVRHRHAASSVEWSPTFTFYTSRNRVLMLAKNGSPWSFLRSYLREVRRCLGSLLRGLARRPGLVPGRPWSEFGVRLRIQLSLLHQIPRALLKRVGILAQ